MWQVLCCLDSSKGKLLLSEFILVSFANLAHLGRSSFTNTCEVCHRTPCQSSSRTASSRMRC